MKNDMLWYAWIFAQNIVNCPNFLSYDIESAKTKVRLLELHIKIIHFLFYYFVINFSQIIDLSHVKLLAILSKSIW
jgi:hypothetical protein